MNEANNNKSKVHHLTDVSRFNRWVNNLDEKDKSLSPKIRKGKWVLIIAGIFFLFGLSFIWFPIANLQSRVPNSPIQQQETQNNPSIQSAFELPVDSFENHLKTIIDEKIPEKE